MKTVTAWNGSSQTYLYDALGRVIQKTENIDNVPYTTAYGYDSKGNNTSVDYQASGFGIRRSFNDNGYLTKITNATNTTTIFDATDAANTIVNALGQYASYKLSNGNIIVNNTYNAYGMPTQFRARKATDAATTYSIQNYQTSFDLQTGNLLSRRDVIANLQEFFTYDANSRLLDNNTTTGTTAGVAPFSITFADNGNINSKTDIGNYTYSSSKIHAVAGVQNTNQPISLRQQDISYSAFQQPTFITEPQANNAANVYGLTYTYGADYQRVKALLTLNGTQQSVRHYLGSYEKNTIGATTEWVHYVSAADGLAAIVTITNNAAPAYHYVFKDHLGSILRVTNATGTTEADQSFDAWGRRRNPTTWAYTGATAPTQTWLYRGYTAHEHLDQFALINMNGRLYDPTVGRMLSPDNYVQDALYAQTFNRYAYAHNNPLKYVDPDGEIAWFIPVIIGAVIGGYAGASIQSGTAAFWKWKQDAWKGAIAGAIIGATLGYSFSATIGASGMTTTVSLTGGGTAQVTTKAAGYISSMLNSGSINIGMNAISGGGWDGAWKVGLVGMASGIWNATGGMGMVKGFGADNTLAKLSGKLGYQIIGTVGGSVGNNWARGEKPFSKVTLGVGPINFTLGKGQQLLQWDNNIGNIAMHSFGLINTAFGGKIGFDWKNLSINYSGGLTDRFLDPNQGWSSGFSPHVITGNSNLSNVYNHELYHLWQSHAFNDSYLLNYGLQGINALLMGGSFLTNYNFYEDVAEGQYWW